MGEGVRAHKKPRRDLALDDFKRKQKQNYMHHANRSRLNEDTEISSNR